jgi:hypothetical protein
MIGNVNSILLVRSKGKTSHIEPGRKNEESDRGINLKTKSASIKNTGALIFRIEASLLLSIRETPQFPAVPSILRMKDTGCLP